MTLYLSRFCGSPEAADLLCNNLMMKKAALQMGREYSEN